MQFLRDEISKFTNEDFSPRCEVSRPLKIFFGWFLPSFLYVIFIEFLSNYQAVEYFNEATKQGIGPNLWNMMGGIGFILFFLAVAFYPLKCISKAAEITLENTFAIGSLMFGLLLGQFVTSTQDMITHLETWKLWITFPLAIFSFSIALFLNTVTWYFSFLIKSDGCFYKKLGKLHPLFMASVRLLSLLAGALVLISYHYT